MSPLTTQAVRTRDVEGLLGDQPDDLVGETSEKPRKGLSATVALPAAQLVVSHLQQTHKDLRGRPGRAQGVFV